MEKDFEAIITIVNSGYEDQVMNDAKECGATGGTIINAKGTAKHDAENFFGLSIHPEKSILLIIAPTKIKNKILEAIYRSFNINKEAQGILFTLPVDNVSENLLNQLDNLEQ
ncbi:MAG: P-II family nitrogen regulator [Clostridia bacterium]|nr:P-II family nitrogen regulator [Clostridia bacterium]